MRRDVDLDGDPIRRQRAEAPRAHEQFRVYLELGPTRSIRRAWDEYRRRYGLPPARIVSGALKRNAIMWRWKERAAWFDARQEERDLEELEKLRRRERARRIKRLEALADRVDVAIPVLDLRQESGASIARAIEILHREQRNELLDNEKQRVAGAAQQAAYLPALEEVLGDDPNGD